MDATTSFTTALRPGERLIAGKPWVFDSGLLGQHLAREAVLSAPRSLSGLTDDAMDLLAYRAHQVDRRPTVVEDLQVHPWTQALVERADAIIAAWCARPSHRAAYGGKAA